MESQSIECYQTPDTTIYRQVNDELIVIQLETGRFFYFSPSTREVLDFFKKPRQWKVFVEAVKNSPTETIDSDYLENFCQLLLQQRIITKTPKAESNEVPTSLKLKKPIFLRQGEKTLDEITFLCP